MLDITRLDKETFEVKTYNGVLHIYPPKLKVVKRLTGILKNNVNEVKADDVDEIFNVFESIINKNREKRTISSKDIENRYDIIDIFIILTGFFEWLNEVSSSKN